MIFFSRVSAKVFFLKAFFFARKREKPFWCFFRFVCWCFCAFGILECGFVLFGFSFCFSRASANFYLFLFFGVARIIFRAKPSKAGHEAGDFRPPYVPKKNLLRALLISTRPSYGFFFLRN